MAAAVAPPPPTRTAFDPASELQHLQSECHSLVQTLQRLRRQEVRLRQQNSILVREAVEAGFRGEMETAWAAKKRKAAARKLAEEKERMEKKAKLAKKGKGSGGAGPREDEDEP
eukprot:CAMPEP_0113568388 /NCGR_PEP_ID=MMETSP0015_2-20120614/23822_1 /TAXON_ID=2838 /ORGANISM="Odontella" /LENGTH=113 /DNA_ID=CAMNT_0000470925 /DNA_START=360 /DNA_END=701 /DNA_ORIENTATION=+ /assembly_acc=CAM_ASM_000160